jgi:hypothetical protein
MVEYLKCSQIRGADSFSRSSIVTRRVQISCFDTNTRTSDFPNSYFEKDTVCLIIYSYFGTFTRHACDSPWFATHGLKTTVIFLILFSFGIFITVSKGIIRKNFFHLSHCPNIYENVISDRLILLYIHQGTAGTAQFLFVYYLKTIAGQKE